MTWRLDPAQIPSDAFRHDPATDRYTVVIPERLNIAEETVGRHARGPRAAAVALVFEAEDGALQPHTYADLDQASTRLAAALRRRGIPSDCRRRIRPSRWALAWCRRGLRKAVALLPHSPASPVRTGRRQ